MDLQVGQLITAPFLPALAEVKKFEPRRGYYQLELLLRDGSHQFLSKNITPAQLSQIRIIERNPIALTDNAEDFFFLIEAHRLRLAYQFDPQLAVSISQVDPLPHQIEAVYHYVLESPRIRFLIADDPGAGKTIMAGLVLKELQYRRLVRRLKEDLRRFDGTPIFPPRYVHTVPFRLTEAETELYNRVTNYVRNYFDRAKENRSISFALMILQRRLTSSTHAVYESLKRRKARLEELLKLPEKIRQVSTPLAAMPAITLSLATPKGSGRAFSGLWRGK